jgi:hypothetical protein
MANQETNSIETRIHKLERENSVFKRALLGISVLFCAVVGMGQAQTSRTVKASNFSLVDAKGDLQAELRLDSSGNPLLMFYSSSGAPNVFISGGSFPTISVGEGPKSSVTMAVSKGIPELRVWDSIGELTSLHKMGCQA